MKLSDQAMGAIMMALQKSLLEQTDIVPVFKGFDLELMDDGTSYEIEQAIIASIQNYEPRAVLDKVTVSDNIDNNSIDVTVRFGIVNVGEIVTVETSLSRLR